MRTCICYTAYDDSQTARPLTNMFEFYARPVGSGSCPCCGRMMLHYLKTSRHRQKTKSTYRIEPHVTCTENFVEFGHVVLRYPSVGLLTDKHTDTLIAILRTPPSSVVGLCRLLGLRNIQNETHTHLLGACIARRREQAITNRTIYYYQNYRRWTRTTCCLSRVARAAHRDGRSV